MSSAQRFATTQLLRGAASPAKRSLSFVPRRHFLAASPRLNDKGDSGIPDVLAGEGAKGSTGGGEPLDSSSRNAPPKPKISNLSVPGVDKSAELTKEQKQEVEEHNREFDKRHDRSEAAPGDKVDEKFWKG